MAYVAPPRVQIRPAVPLAARQIVLGFLLGIPAFLFLALGMLLAYQFGYRDNIYLHIKANGVDVGGLTRPAAQARLDEYFRGYAEQPLTLTDGDQTWAITPADLGLRTDTAGLVEDAYQIGRDGSPIDRLIAPIRLRNGTTIETAPTLAPEVSNRVLAGLAAEIDQAPVDARLAVRDGGVTIEEAVPGRRLNRELTQRRLTAAIEALDDRPVALAIEPVPPRVVAADLQPAAEKAGAVLAGRPALTFDGRQYPLDPVVIREALRFEGSGAATTIAVASEPLRAPVRALAGEINRPARNALLTIAGGKVNFDAGQTARTLQVDATVEALRRALLAGETAVPLVVRETPPAVTAARWTEARRTAEQILSAPLAIKTPLGEQWSVSTADLASMIVVKEPAEGKPGAVTLDEKAVSTLVAGWSERINRSAIAAKLDWNGGDIRVIREGRRGYELNRAEAVAAVEAAALSDKRVVELPVSAWGTNVNQANVAGLGIKELVVENSTSYAGSIPSRAHNVELAAERLHGTLVGPGEQFSFNRAVGPTTLEAGFEWGYGIVNTGNGLKTVPSVAGGICQVATTLFQPVFWGGYQIDERLEHSYWIPKYASKGMPGLDTTVDEPSGLDFWFTNNTDHYLLIQSWYQDEKLHFALYGTKPDWNVKVLEPAIRDRVKADETIVREKSDRLPASETLWAEHAADGFTVTITRIVSEDGKSRQQSFTSHYKPARNVILVGTG